MTAPHRVCLPPRDPAPQGVTCPRCHHRNRIGFEFCARCRAPLFRDHHPRLYGVGLFSEVVRQGGDMPVVTGYLRHNQYPIGESPERYWRRKRRQAARELRRRAER